jgi:hypothetical protein
MIDAPTQPIRIGNPWRDNGASNPQPYIVIDYFGFSVLQMM